MNTVLKTKSESVGERALAVMIDINKSIYNNEKFSLTEIIKRNGGQSTWVTAIKQRNILRKSTVSNKYKWENGQLSQDTPQLKLFAQWMIQDANEYNRKFYHKSRKKKGIENQSAPVVMINKHKVPAITKNNDTYINVEDGWSPITKNTLLGLGSINNFEPIVFNYNQIRIYNINKIEFNTHSTNDDLVITLKDSSDKLISNLIIEDKKLYKFMKTEDTFKFEIF